MSEDVQQDEGLCRALETGGTSERWAVLYGYSSNVFDQGTNATSRISKLVFAHNVLIGPHSRVSINSREAFLRTLTYKRL